MCKRLATVYNGSSANKAYLFWVESEFLTPGTRDEVYEPSKLLGFCRWWDGNGRADGSE